MGLKGFNGVFCEKSKSAIGNQFQNFGHQTLIFSLIGNLLVAISGFIFTYKYPKVLCYILSNDMGYGVNTK